MEKIKKIVIDAGHNYSGYDTGAEGHGQREQDVTFEIASLAGEILKSRGFLIRLTRSSLTQNIGSGTVASSLSARAETANSFGADLFLSIHCNAYTNAEANGTECYVYALGGEAEELAKKINSAIVKALGTADRGVLPRPALAVLRLTSMPAVLIETAFITNPSDAAKLRANKREFAAAISEAVCAHYGVLPMQNEYSYDDTVNNMILDGITTPENMEYWEKALDGREPVNREFVRIILDRYHEKLKGKK